MKILHVVHQFLPYHHHGAEISTYELGVMQQAAGHEVVVVAGETSPHEQCLFHEQYSYRELKVHRIYFNPQTPNGWLSHDGFAQLWRGLVESEQPDLVHVQHLMNLSLSLVDVTHEMGIPLVLTLRDFSLLCPRINLVKGDGNVCIDPDLESDCLPCLKQKRPMESGDLLPAAVDLLRENILSPRSWDILRRLISARLRSRKVFPPLSLSSGDDILRRNEEVIRRLQKFDRITAISEDTASRFERLADNRVSVQTLQQVPDTGRCLWKQRIRGDGHLRFGYLGKMSYVKGVHLLLRAFRYLPLGQAKLLLFGGPTRTDIRQLAFWRKLKRLSKWPGVQIFSDPFDPAEIAEVMNQIDVLIVPSIWFEAYGRVVAEALASGIPVICSDEGGPASVIQPDINGLTFHLGDEMDLVTKMRRFIDEPDLLERMSSEAHPPKTPDQYLDEVLSMYADVIEKKL
ncbi:D-inositol 3-phosphate glycosyltransferase [bacterium BMS3Bbin04]|nr:D-inositol 3-phosphate glycosyltransferase [bacterium BMS3Bbin04]